MAYSTIPKGNLHMNPVIYTGNGSTQSITGLEFQPDWVWIKKRSGAANHYLVDVIRGASKVIYSNASNAQETNLNAITSLNSNGFSLGTDSDTNANSATFVSWNWKAGTGQGSPNTDGSINTTYTSVNTTAGISISQYTGNATDNASVGHGLGTAPKMLIIKEITSTSNWGVWHQDLTDGGYRLSLQETTAQVSDTAFMGGGNRAIPTNSVFYLGSGGGGNSSSDNYIAYAFSEIKGFSKFGKYVGNGSTDGTFVYTGFKPAFILQKRYDNNGEGWGMFDTTRSPINESKNMLLANSNALEDTSNAARIDFLSNGFKWRTTDTWFNPNGGSCIYMAFAENPFVATSGTNAIPVTAR